eukprot:TRINITY_DN55657_c0_g1_i1.p1 TRINITY_DN55657_c0_g1~~TRINITY_DN55657_c0_g1_i1.p1  ORF type:complete len:213 (-),score=47.49 TRINITY_DN55657_c0_g1_i1:16-618(-)
MACYEEARAALARDLSVGFVGGGEPGVTACQAHATFAESDDIVGDTPSAAVDFCVCIADPGAGAKIDSESKSIFAGALSLGIFSHALDARHIAAGIHMLQQWPLEIGQQLFETIVEEFPGHGSFGMFLMSANATHGGVRNDDGDAGSRRKPHNKLVEELRRGMDAFRRLLDRCGSGEADPCEAEFVRLRLKQALMLHIYN